MICELNDDDECTSLIREYLEYVDEWENILTNPYNHIFFIGDDDDFLDYDDENDDVDSRIFISMNDLYEFANENIASDIITVTAIMRDETTTISIPVMKTFNVDKKTHSIYSITSEIFDEENPGFLWLKNHTNKMKKPFKAGDVVIWEQTDKHVSCVVDKTYKRDHIIKNGFLVPLIVMENSNHMSGLIRVIQPFTNLYPVHKKYITDTQNLIRNVVRGKCSFASLFAELDEEDDCE